MSPLNAKPAAVIIAGTEAAGKVTERGTGDPLSAFFRGGLGSLVVSFIAWLSHTLKPPQAEVRVSAVQLNQHLISRFLT